MRRNPLKNTLALVLAFTMFYETFPIAFAEELQPAQETTQTIETKDSLQDTDIIAEDLTQDLTVFDDFSEEEIQPTDEEEQPSEAQDESEIEQPIRNLYTSEGFIRIPDQEQPISEQEIEDLLESKSVNLEAYTEKEYAQKQEELRDAYANEWGISQADLNKAAQLHGSIGALQ